MSETAVKYSIVIPAYNAAAHVLSALQSLTRQTYGNLQIVVVNDGSSDGTGKVVQDFIGENPQAEIVYCEIENSGPSTARNVGLSFVNGDYVAFLDADDRYAPNLFEKLSQIEEEFDICFFGWREVDSDGNEVGRYEDRFTYFDAAVSGVEAAKNKLSSKIWLCNCNEIYKVETLKKNNVLYPQGCYAGEDACFIYAALLASQKVVCLRYDGFINVFRPDSLMHASFREHYLTEYPAMDALINSTKENCVLSASEKEFFIKEFRGLKYLVELSIAKRLALMPCSYAQYGALVKKYRALNDVSYKEVKKCISSAKKKELFLYKRSLWLFRIVYRLFKKEKK